MTDKLAALDDIYKMKLQRLTSEQLAQEWEVVKNGPDTLDIPGDPFDRRVVELASLPKDPDENWDWSPLYDKWLAICAEARRRINPETAEVRPTFIEAIVDLHDVPKIPLSEMTDECLSQKWQSIYADILSHNYGYNYGSYMQSCLDMQQIEQERDQRAMAIIAGSAHI